MTPRPVEIQGDVRRTETGEIEYVKFEESTEGIIQSHVFHHQDSFEDIYSIWNEYRKYFRHQDE